MSDVFKDQVAVITGAGGVLCSEIAVDLASKGVKTVLVGRTEEKLQKVANQILAAGGTCMVRTGDVTDEAAMSALAEEVEKVYGSCRYLINGAGGNNNKAITTNFTFEPEEIKEEKPDQMVGFFDLDMEVFESVVKINTLGTVISVRAFAKQMARAGRGSILNFASMNSSRPLTRVPAYAMSKAAVVNFTQWLATYLAPAGIRVNAVAPGFFVNERSRKILCTPEGGLTKRGENIMNHTPMERFGEPAELLGCVSWLLDDEKASFVTGITVPVDGGFLAHSGI
ncbi:SDR family NAD(P)-dependent oxidoreductase [Hungatella hathewayi]|uniref:SDR family NAD(P)-dependent oxidoreductase n=1 Tax=Hungatella hathewayi TaxID=154046 RepID=UPI003565F8B7